jgi:hypothetical protein
MTSEKKQTISATTVLNLIFYAAFVFSQAFYLTVLVQQGPESLATHLALSVPGPHIHEVIKNPSLFSNETNGRSAPTFDVLQKAFSWPMSGVGLLTGLGVALTSLVFNIFDWLLMGIILLVLYLALLLSPILFLASFLLLFSQGRPWGHHQKTLITIAASFLLMGTMTVLITLGGHFAAGWRAAIIFGALFLYKDAGFYLNPAVYGTIMVVFDYLLVKKVLGLRKNLKNFQKG